MQNRPSSRHSISHLSHMGPIPHSSRPILAIDTAPHPNVHRPASLSVSRDVPQGDPRTSPVTRPMPENNPTSASTKAGALRQSSRFLLDYPSLTIKPSIGTTKQRTKKITVACNFCRCKTGLLDCLLYFIDRFSTLARKLKCDGGRPACGQCLKRSNPCDYMPQNKRRGTMRQRNKGEESESESGDERSAEAEEPSLSPEIPSQPLSHRSSNADKHHYEDGFPPQLPPMSTIHERREDHPLASSSKPHQMGREQRTFFPDNELPHIATLSLPDPSPSTPAPMSAPSLPPLRPASEQQAAQRKRAATVPGKSNRNSSSSGPKVVACNFCRGKSWLTVNIEVLTASNSS